MVLSELVVYGRDASSSQAEGLGKHSKVPFTAQRQLDMYISSRVQNRLDSDQVVYAAVLDQTGGPVDVFIAKYPHISFSRVEELRPKEELALTG